MAVIAASTFDGATSGTATAATTGCSSVFGDAAARQHTTAQKINGASVIFTGTTTSYLQWSFATTQKVYTRFYFRRETVSTSATACVMAVLRSASLMNAKLGWAPTTGELRVLNVGTVVATYPVTTGQWYRVDWSVDQSVSQQMVRLYTGATIHSASTADAVAGGTPVAVDATGLINRLLLGEQFAVTPAVDFYVDELVMDGAALPAPFVPPVANDCWVYNGTTEVPANVTVWDGASGVAAGIEVTA